MTDLQWLSSKVNIVGHIPWVFKSCLRHGGEITCEITGRRRMSDVDDKGLEVPCTWCVYTFFGNPRDCLSNYLWRLQTARTSCLPFKSTGFLQSHNSHKRFLKMPCDIRRPFPLHGRVSNWQSHNSHKRVLKMPLVVAVVSISKNSTY